jgi:hypothetical protein
MSNVVDNKDRNNDIEIAINNTKLRIIQFMAEIQDCDSEVKTAENVLKVTNTNVKNAEDRLIDLGFELTKEQISNVSTILDEELSGPLKEIITRGVIRCGDGWLLLPRRSE